MMDAKIKFSGDDNYLLLQLELLLQQLQYSRIH
jgi:hypothetical protein